MALPFSTNYESGLGLDEAETLFASIEGDPRRSFECSTLKCTTLSAANVNDDVDIGDVKTGNLFINSNPTPKLVPAGTISVKEKLDEIRAPHTFITGAVTNWMSSEITYVMWTRPFLAGGSSLVLPTSIKLLRCTLKYYSNTGIVLPGNTTCTLELCKYLTSHVTNSLKSTDVAVTKIADLYQFNSVHFGYPGINIDMRTLNRGAPYELLANESLILRFQRSMANNEAPISDVLNAEIQVCLYCELGA
jgi:hypothetical protein